MNIRVDANELWRAAASLLAQWQGTSAAKPLHVKVPGMAIPASITKRWATSDSIW
jgi:hypothetical protein